MLRLPGSRSVGWPLRYTSASCDHDALAEPSRAGGTAYSLSVGISLRASSQAMPRPTICWHRQRAGAHAALVAAAVDDRFEPHARVLLADVQGADALRPVNLVGRQAQQVDAHLFDVDRHLADGLHGVGVEEDALFLAQLGRSP